MEVTAENIAAIAAHRITKRKEWTDKNRNTPPSEWIAANLHDNLFPFQKEIADRLQHENIAVTACHSSGKTFLAADIALWFFYHYYPCKVITTAPTDRQVRELLWSEIHAKFNAAKISLPGQLLLQRLSTTPDHFMLGFTAEAKQGVRFQGFHSDNLLVIVDESSGITGDIYEAIDGITSGGNARILMIGNPIVAMGRFYQTFKNPGDFWTVNISAFETPNFVSQGITIDDIRSGEWRNKDDKEKHIAGLIRPDWVAKIYEREGEKSAYWISRVLGRFPEEAEGGLIPLWAVEQCQQKDSIKLTEEEIKAIDAEGEIIKEVIIDVARSLAGDETVIGTRCGKKIAYHWIGKTNDTMVICGKAVQAFNKIGAKRIKVDVIGVGAGVCDRLKEIGNDHGKLAFEVIEINAAGKPKKGDDFNDDNERGERFLNVRAEMYWETREAMLNGGWQIPDDDLLKYQLASILYGTTSAGKIQLESKEKLKKRIGQSPDRADMIAMAIYEPEAYSPLIIGMC